MPKNLKEKIKKITPAFLLSLYHLSLSFLSALFYGFPSRKLTVIGITGTKGKTTTVELVRSIIAESGAKTASVSSLRFCVGDKKELNALKMTMPGRFFLQKFLHRAVKEKCKYAVLEITSEGILQHRHRFIRFQTAVFTNLAPEHIERHGSLAEYRKAKGKLFKACKGKHVVNMDDKNKDYFLKFPAKEKWGFSLKQKEQGNEKKEIKTVCAENVKIYKEGSFFTIKGQEFNISLKGKFNVYNCVCAISTALAQSIPLEVCVRALTKKISMPGRMELVIQQPFRVVVDLAHTPDSLREVCSFFAQEPGRLICVFGCAGGGRDKWKRPIMGRIAAEYCQKIILTNEDAYPEKPEDIIKSIKEGIKGKGTKKNEAVACYEIVNRREAIRKALILAQPNDTVLISGKGTEQWLYLSDGRKIPWDDRKVVLEEYERLKKEL